MQELVCKGAIGKEGFSVTVLSTSSWMTAGRRNLSKEEELSARQSAAVRKGGYNMKAGNFANAVLQETCPLLQPGQSGPCLQATARIGVHSGIFAGFRWLLPVTLAITLAGAFTGGAKLAHAQPTGWDYDLRKKCAKTSSPGQANYFEVTDQCLNYKRWTLVVESGNEPTGTCPPPATQSFLINGPNSPVTMQWFPHTSDLGPNWTVNMKVDHYNHPHPCGSGFFTFFGFMDQADLGGGPLPIPSELISSHLLAYNQWAPSSSDEVRLILGAQSFWNGKAHILEINAAQVNWGDAHPHPGVLSVSHNWGPNGDEFVTLYGPYWGISVPPGGGAVTRFVDWKGLIRLAADNGWFTPPASWTATHTATTAVYVGVEVKNRGVGELWHTNFRIARQQ